MTMISASMPMGQGAVIRKTVPGTGVLDQNEIHFIRLDRSR
jgi:hypothetical protein